MEEMKTVNSLSGGRSSAYMAVKYPADYNVFALCCIDRPTKKLIDKFKDVAPWVNEKLGERYIKTFGEFKASTESVKTLVLMRDLEQIIGREITWVRDRGFDDIIHNGGNKGQIDRLPSPLFRICTEIMKLDAIFKWWYFNISEKVNMRVGFRADEFDRMVRFFNSKTSPTNYKFPTRQRVSYGSGKHPKAKPGDRIFEEFNFRFCQMPMVKDGVFSDDVRRFWSDFHSGLFPLPSGNYSLVFPAVSNCAGCFHHKPGELCVSWNEEPEIMEWFSDQEKIGKGTWKNGVTYERMRSVAETWTPEMVVGETTCDTGGCTN